MKFCAVCNEGFEDLVEDELERKLGIRGEPRAASVIFECPAEDAMRFTYLTQSSKRVLKLVGEFRAHDEAELLEKAKGMAYDIPEGSFCVRCSRHTLEKDLGAAVYSSLDSPKVDMSSPDNQVFFHWAKAADGVLDVVIGIDISQQDLSKRSYKIFAHPSSIKGTLAYYMVALSGYKGEGTLLDPCSGSGTICAEAAYIATGISPRYFDKDTFRACLSCNREWKPVMESYDERNSKHLKKLSLGPILSYDVDLQAVNSTKKNLKVGGIDKFVSVARGDIDWLETKFEESSVDYIVSNPPHYSKHNTKKNDKFFDKLFYQTAFVLSPDGKMVLLTNSERPMEISKKYGLTPSIEKRFSQGSSEKFILSFVKLRG